MKLKQSLIFFHILVCFCGCLCAQTAAGIIDPSRRIDWSSAGIPGGIPNRTTICATINAATYGNGSSDATSGIQTALNSCTANQTVLLSAGTFRINSSLTIPSNVTLRGAGANQTILNAQGNAYGVVAMGQNNNNVVAGAGSPTINSGSVTSGSTSFTVSSASGITVGSYMVITELDDANYVSRGGVQGTCTWCDAGMFSGAARSRGQIVEVTSVSGTTIGFSPALYSNYGVATGTSPALATPFTASAKYAGLENLQIYANNTGYTTNVLINRGAYCWVKGVESNFADGDHVQVWTGYHNEIRDNYFHDGYKHTSGQTDNDIFIVVKTTGTLIENNIITRLHSSVIMNWGAAGNVTAYNYFDGNYDTDAPNVLIYDQTSHGAHPQFNLWESNVGPSWHPDGIWGTSSHHTAFRQWTIGTTQICLPYSARGAAGACHAPTQALRATGINAPVTYSNLVGNIAGSALLNSQTTETAVTVAPESRLYSGGGYDMDFGFGGSGDGSSYGSVPSLFQCTTNRAGCLAYSTALIHGVYTNANATTIWDSTITNHTLPASLYLSSKPSWFGSITWPAIGPDVTGGPGPAGHTYAIPAQVCYSNIRAGAFNADTCYGKQVSPSTVAPPINLTAVVH